MSTEAETRKELIDAKLKEAGWGSGSILMDYNVGDRPAYRRFDRYQSYTDFGSIFLLPIAFLVGACVRYILYLRREMLPVHNLMSFLYNSGRDRQPK